MKKIILLLLFASILTGAQAQYIYNNGAHIVSGSGSYWVLDNDDFTLISTSTSNLAQLDNLTIMGDASLTLGTTSAPSYLTVSGDLTVNSGGSLTVVSSANGTGSLIVEGTPSGNVTIQRFLTADKWHYISGQSNISTDFSNTMGLGTPGSSSNSFYRWDESYVTNETPGTWIDILNGPTGDGTNNEMDETFVSCRGYGVTYATSDKTLSLSGVPYVANQSISITKTAGSTNSGSNLVGNPFTSNIAANENADANSFLSTNSGILSETKSAIYLWNEQNGYTGSRDDYITISNSGDAAYLASGQAFMVVKRNEGSTSLPFNINMRKHGTATFYKDANYADVSRFYMSVSNEGNLYNEILIAFKDGMSDGLDVSYDAGKLKGNPDIALYTKLVDDIGVDFAHQALPPLVDEAVAVKTCVDVSTAGIYTFRIKELQNFDESIKIKLEDKETNMLIDFRELGEYSFAIEEPGEIRERFVLHFNGTTGIEEEMENNLGLVQLWTRDNTLHLFNPNSKTGQIQLFSILGQPLMQAEMTRDTKQEFKLNVEGGYYVVRITGDDYITNNKIYLK